MRLMVHPVAKEADLRSALNSYLCQQGGRRRLGMAPKGATQREVEVLLGLMDGAEDENWE